MPLLLSYLKSVPPGHTHHLAKACYALENFVENLGSEGIWGCEGADGAVVLAERARMCSSINHCPWWGQVWQGDRRGGATRRIGLEAGMRTLVDGGVPFPTGPKVQPYLPELMECMLQPLRTPSSSRSKELAVSALGAIGESEAGGGRPGFTHRSLTCRACGRYPGSPAGSESVLPSIATAAQASMLPYFPTIMAHLREFLLTSHEDLQPVRIQSLGK